MCGRYSLAVALPNQFAESVLNRGSEEYLEVRDNPHVYRNRNPDGSESNDSEITLALGHELREFSPAYNIPPTSNAVIVYQKVNTSKQTVYQFEVSSFGLVPVWAKPQDVTPVRRKGLEGLPYSRELGAMQAKHFNCRKETVAKPTSIWNSVKRTRCVVPIQGYFEWNTVNGQKIPYYVHSKQYPLLFLAGFYAHNPHYEDQFQNKSDGYFSSFTIVTGPSAQGDVGDIAWLHPRKPIMVLPGSKEWDQWLDPTRDWSDEFFDTSLNTKENNAYKEVECYRVTKDVGSPANQGEYLIKEIKQDKGTQKGIDSFFRKRPARESQQTAKKIKTEDGSDISDSKNQESDSKTTVKKEET